MQMENKNFNWQRETNPEKLNSNPYQVNVDAMPIQLNYIISLKQWTMDNGQLNTKGLSMDN